MNRIQLRFGQAVGLKELIATLVVSGVLLIVGTVVFAKVKGAMGGDTSPDTCYEQTNNTDCFTTYNESAHENLTISGDAGTAMANVETTTYDAFELATVALIVNHLTKFKYFSIWSKFSCCCYHWYLNQSIWCLRFSMNLTFWVLPSVNPSGGMVGNDHPHFFY